MSHYTVLVVSKSPDEVEGLLVPFNEELRTDPRDGDDIDLADVTEFYATATSEGSEEVRVALAAGNPTPALNRWFGEDNWRRREDGTFVEVTTYNPDSKWDWYQIGGRWAGKFLLKDGSASDQAQVRDIDFAGMRAARRLRALETLDRYRKAVETFGPLPSRDWVKLPADSPEFAQRKAEFWDHGAVKALMGFSGPLDWEDVEHLEQSPDGWVLSEEVQAVVGWAVLTHDGHWLEQGSMGWFGMSDTTMSSRIGYLEVAGAYVEGLDDDVWLTNVDVHI